MAANEDRIRQRAYQIWEQEGRPHGNDLKHWMQAFQEIAESAGAVGAKAPRTKKAAAPKSVGTAKPKAASSKGAKAKPAAGAQSAPASTPPSKASKPARGVTTH